MTKNIILLFLLPGVFSCKQGTQAGVQNEKEKVATVPVFNADSAYHYTEAQVLFGPRVPNTSAHEACGRYLAGQLKRFGAELTEQEMTLYLQDNTPIQAKNIIGSFQPENKSRVLLFAHWDSRPVADRDPNPGNWNKPIDGANDGAGACGVLLEIARQISIMQPAIGIDMIFFDAEDWGEPSFPVKNKHYGNWCMGSEYWAKNPHIPNYKARYGILLDMVSAPGALFYKESLSWFQAQQIVKKVWEAARVTGYGAYFADQEGGQIMDDHVPVIKYRKFPCINIIQYDPSTGTGFGPYWHTLEDHMKNVDKTTLQAVGQTVLHVLYNEK